MPDASTVSGTDVTSETIVIEVRFFAHYRDLAGMPAREVELVHDSTVGDLVTLLRADHGLTSLPAELLVAVNRDYADFATRLSTGDEVALIPPVSGG